MDNKTKLIIETIGFIPTFKKPSNGQRLILDEKVVSSSNLQGILSTFTSLLLYFNHFIRSNPKSSSILTRWFSMVNEPFVIVTFSFIHMRENPSTTYDRKAMVTDFNKSLESMHCFFEEYEGMIKRQLLNSGEGPNLESALSSIHLLKNKVSPLNPSRIPLHKVSMALIHLAASEVGISKNDVYTDLATLMNDNSTKSNIDRYATAATRAVHEYPFHNLVIWGTPIQKNTRLLKLKDKLCP